MTGHIDDIDGNLQFIDFGSGCGAAGKNNMTQETNKKHIATMLIPSPARPREKRALGRGSPKRRLYIRQPIAIM